MADQTAFILAPATSSNLHQSQSLNLLPFSLGPPSNPYTSTSTPLETYFQPRPCPSNHSSLAEGTPIAAFRGRQLVGQNVEVPKGYKGLILRSGPRPDRGGVAETRGKAKEGKWPLTPATSVASSSSIASASTGATDIDGVRRSPWKTRGAGQVALSKPRQTFKRGLRKRLRLDSDSEEDEVPSLPTTTPSKRQKAKAQTTPVKPIPITLPEIKVQSPTPRKHQPDEDEPLWRLRGPTGMEENDPYGGIDESERNEVKVEIDEAVVPSPATEDLPPLFKVESKVDIVEDAKVADLEGAAGQADIDEGHSGETGLVRHLRPISVFDSITLWTADTPLAGFRQNELLDRAGGQSGEHSVPAMGTDSKEDLSTTQAAQPDDAEAGGTTANGPPAAQDEDKSTELNPGWWRTGGAGEGGDEFVRGMGEWLGLVHMINDPIYLRDLPKEGEEEDDY